MHARGLVNGSGLYSDIVLADEWVHTRRSAILICGRRTHCVHTWNPIDIVVSASAPDHSGPATLVLCGAWLRAEGDQGAELAFTQLICRC